MGRRHCTTTFKTASGLTVRVWYPYKEHIRTCGVASCCKHSNCNRFQTHTRTRTKFTDSLDFWDHLCLGTFKIFRIFKQFDSGCQDEFEKLWAEEVAETEDDVMSLAVSFLLVQALWCAFRIFNSRIQNDSNISQIYRLATVEALRFLISGHLPDTEAPVTKGIWLNMPYAYMRHMLMLHLLFLLLVQSTPWG